MTRVSFGRRTLCAAAAMVATLCSPRAFAIPPAAPAPAPADPASSPEEIARMHFKNGVRLYDAQPTPDYAAALVEFRAAYAAHPSAGIKQNIALCYKAMHKYPEAVDTLNEMLEEGGASLKPETRRAAEEAVTEMTALIATVLIRVKLHGPRGSKPLVLSLFLDGEPLPVEALAKPVRLGSGSHVFSVHAAGYADVPPREVKLSGGDRDVPVQLDLSPERPANGTLFVRAGAADVISVDGAEVAKGEWSGSLSAGPHKVRVARVSGSVTNAEVNVVGGEPREYVPAPEVDTPPPYVPPPEQPRVLDRKWYAAAGLAVHTESLRLSPALDEPPGGTRRDFSGVSVSLKGGRRISRFFSVEIHAEIGTLRNDSYDSPNNSAVTAATDIDMWLLAPMLRFNTTGRLRFVGGVGVGLESHALTATLGQAPPAATDARVGSGINAAFVSEAGAQYEIGKVFLEAAGIFDVHGVGAAQDPNGERFFLDSPAVRWGGRVMVGLGF